MNVQIYLILYQLLFVRVITLLENISDLFDKFYLCDNLDRTRKNGLEDIIINTLKTQIQNSETNIIYQHTLENQKLIEIQKKRDEK